MNTTLTVVVAAIVILITALVVITIFGTGMTDVGTLAQAETYCMTQCETSCRTTGQTPITWNVPNVRQAGNPISCADVFTGKTATCENGACKGL